MQRKITYYVDKIKPGQKISGFLKEKGYSEQNLVNLNLYLHKLNCIICYLANSHSNE